jgi:hypothetical protein
MTHKLDTCFGHQPILTGVSNLKDVYFSIPIPVDARRLLARGWLWLGLLALISSGVFSLLLVASRTPGINQILPGSDFFKTALVLHVDLSVLVWFVAFAGLLWSINGNRIGILWGWTALVLSGIGTGVMSISAFVAQGDPIMANYIPVINNKLFIYFWTTRFRSRFSSVGHAWIA